jgi:endonuclease YncB( thermonuclease family)
VLRRLPVALALVLAGLAAGALAPAARAASWRCAPVASSPRCHVTDVRVTQISDGDTIGVRLGRGTKDVRFTGINAMELTRYSNHPGRRRGACHGLEAAAVVDRLVRAAHWRVRLSAQRASSSSGHRLRRTVWARVGGRWVDVGRQVIARGLALWLPNGAEWAHDHEYHELAEAARARGVGLWDPTACGGGPDQAARLELRAKYDADGNDAANLNGEWTEVRNRGDRTVSLAGWWLRDSDLRSGAGGAPGFRFPPGTTVPAGGAVVLHSGCGRDEGPDLHWCQTVPVLDNASSDARAFGDGAYLFDPQGDLRVSTTWPCLRACADPLRGRVRLTVHPRTPEQVTVTNTSAGEVDLDGHLLALHLRGHAGSYTWSSPFPESARLDPGETLRIDPAGGRVQDTRLLWHLGRGRNLLADGGNAVSLRSFTDVQVTCTAWGSWHC